VWGRRYPYKDAHMVPYPWGQKPWQARSLGISISGKGFWFPEEAETDNIAKSRQKGEVWEKGRGPTASLGRGIQLCWPGNEGGGGKGRDRIVHGEMRKNPKSIGGGASLQSRDVIID